MKTSHITATSRKRPWFSGIKKIGRISSIRLICWYGVVANRAPNPHPRLNRAIRARPEREYTGIFAVRSLRNCDYIVNI